MRALFLSNSLSFFVCTSSGSVDAEHGYLNVGPLYIQANQTSGSLATPAPRYRINLQFAHLNHREFVRLGMTVLAANSSKLLRLDTAPAEWFSYQPTAKPSSAHQNLHVSVHGIPAVCRSESPEGCFVDISKFRGRRSFDQPATKTFDEGSLVIPHHASLASGRWSRRRLLKESSEYKAQAISGVVKWSQVKHKFTEGSDVMVEAGSRLDLDSDMNVASLTVEGSLVWDTKVDDILLQAGFVLVLNNGSFVLGTAERPMERKATIYLKNNGRRHPEYPYIGYRFLGGHVQAQDRSRLSPRVHIHGAKLARTWSLLSASAPAGKTKITVMHDVAAIGWKIGDTIAVASTLRYGKLEPSQKFRITGIKGKRISLSQATNQEYLGGGDSYAQAEVINLSRNVLITGDDFEDSRGLHTVMHTGGIMQISHTRVEKCGQRGEQGRYCLHFHVLKSCPMCKFTGNAVEDSFQRGIVVHGTHNSKVEDNVLFMIRGAGIYVEDGNELHNLFKNNVVLCPDASKNRDKCRLQGTDNVQADYEQQSGIWALSVTNDFVGNRLVGSFNGLFTQTSHAPSGRGQAHGKLCAIYGPFGLMEGNVNHNCARFGYYLDKNWPRNLRQSVASNGFVEDISECRRGDESWCSCQPFTADGEDNGVVAVVKDGLDYHNNLVGQYELGDVQWDHFRSINNNHGMYWKETKNFADGCSVHVKNSVFMNTEVGGALRA